MRCGNARVDFEHASRRRFVGDRRRAERHACRARSRVRIVSGIAQRDLRVICRRKRGKIRERDVRVPVEIELHDVRSRAEKCGNIARVCRAVFQHTAVENDGCRSRECAVGFERKRSRAFERKRGIRQRSRAGKAKRAALLHRCALRENVPARVGEIQRAAERNDERGVRSREPALARNFKKRISREHGSDFVLRAQRDTFGARRGIARSDSGVAENHGIPRRKRDVAGFFRIPVRARRVPRGVAVLVLPDETPVRIDGEHERAVFEFERKTIGGIIRERVCSVGQRACGVAGEQGVGPFRERSRRIQFDENIERVRRERSRRKRASRRARSEIVVQIERGRSGRFRAGVRIGRCRSRADDGVERERFCALERKFERIRKRDFRRGRDSARRRAFEQRELRSRARRNRSRECVCGVPAERDVRARRDGCRRSRGAGDSALQAQHASAVRRERCRRSRERDASRKARRVLRGKNFRTVRERKCVPVSVDDIASGASGIVKLQTQSRVERNRAAAERRRSRVLIRAAAHAQGESAGAVCVLNFQISVIARRVRFERKPAIAGNRQRPFGAAENRAVNRAVLAVPVIPRSDGRVRRERDVPVDRRAAIHRERAELFPAVYGETRVLTVAAPSVLSRETAPVEDKIRVSADEIRVRAVVGIRHAHLRTGRNFDGRVLQRIKIAGAVEIFPDKQARVALDSDRAVERFRLRKQNGRNFGFVFCHLLSKQIING